MSKNKIAFPLLVFMVALVVRLIPVLMSRNLGIGLDDMFQYDMLARSIASGNGYRWYAQDDLYLVQQYLPFDISTVDYDPRGVLTSFRPPLYPAFLALIYLINGISADRFFTARLVQAGLNALLVPMTYFASLYIFPDRPRVSKWAAWALVFYPMMVIYPLSLATENLFFVLVLASALALYKTVRDQRLRWFALSGMLIGLASLTRSVILPFSMVAALWAWIGLKNWKGGLTLLAVAVLVVSPWVARNSLLHGRLVGVESSLGYNLYVGYHPLSTGTFQYGISLDLIPMLDDGLRDKIGTEKAMEFIRNDPSRIIPLAVMRAGYFFGMEKRALLYFYSNNFFGYISTPLLLSIALIFVVPFMVLSTSSAYGLALANWKRLEVVLTGLLLITYIAPHILLLAEDRFHLTLVPFFAILAARFWDGGIREIKSLFQGSSFGKLLVVSATVVVFLLIFNWGYEVYRDMDKLMVIFGPSGNITGFPY